MRIFLFCGSHVKIDETINEKKTKTGSIRNEELPAIMATLTFAPRQKSCILQQIKQKQKIILKHNHLKRIE